MASKAEVEKAQQSAIDKLDIAEADFAGSIAELKEKLSEVSALLGSPAAGMHEEGIRALSGACTIEYDLRGDTAATSGYAQALGLEDELGEFEESQLPNDQKETP